MKSSLIIALLLFFVSCGKDEKLRVIHNNDRVADLERRVTLLEQIVQTKADAQALQDLSTFVNSQLTQLSAELAVIQSDYLTSEDADELIELGEAAYQELLSKINDLRSRVSALEGDPRLDEVIQALEDLQQEVADIEPVVNNDNSVTYEVTEVVFNFGNLFTYIDNSVTNITQDSTDLTEILARLTALESSQGRVEELERELEDLKSKVNDLQSSSGGSSPQVVFVQVVNRVNGMNNNASVTIKLKNISSVTVSKFRVKFQTDGNAVTRSGSSMSNGNVTEFSSDSVTFQNTSSGFAPGVEFTVTILLDNLTGRDNLNFTIEVL